MTHTDPRLYAATPSAPVPALVLPNSMSGAAGMEVLVISAPSRYTFVRPGGSKLPDQFACAVEFPGHAAVNASTGHRYGIEAAALLVIGGDPDAVTGTIGTEVFK